uniref:Uncharacterized protein n=1 Tax=Glossina palpalis gambiensis TaxID=67801 RepID=A0A1B0B9H4_9MUSC
MQEMAANGNKEMPLVCIYCLIIQSCHSLTILTPILSSITGESANYVLIVVASHPSFRVLLPRASDI